MGVLGVMLFSFLERGEGTFNLRNTSLNLETHAWVFLVSRSGFPLLFCVFHSSRLLQTSETHPASDLSGCVVWGNSECLVGLFYLLLVCILGSLRFSIIKVEQLSTLYVLNDVLDEEEGKC